MRFRKFETLISPARLLRYKASCINNTRRTTQLYRANIRISQAFLATLSIFEIVLRNKIDLHYTAQFPAVAGQNKWLLSSISPSGFLAQPSCQKTYKKINEAYVKLGASYTHDKLLAELSFGVWKFMFAGHQFQAGGSTLLSIFPNLPHQHNQSHIYAKLNKINAIRNRVAHHEPICFGNGNIISTIYARTHFQEIVDILTWMDINHQELFWGIDRVLKEADYIDNI